MNNLLKTISDSHVHSSLPDVDLKSLLSSVSHIRSQDAKAADSFYASLESVLLELRTVTPDSRDAEAFLKPVPKSDYPDYYEVIKHPMDLGTMLKLVKARKYKTKQEFADDLSLIWKNCFKYNSGPEHVLRGCATRLRRKAEHLLAHVSDRPDNITINGLPKPSIPPPVCSFHDRPFKPFAVNGTTYARDMSSPEPTSPHVGVTPNTPGPSYSKSPNSISGQSVVMKNSPSSCHGNSPPFDSQPALIRTSAAMSLFSELDAEITFALENASLRNIDGAFPSHGSMANDKGKGYLLDKLYSIVDDSDDVGVDESSAEKDAPEDHHSRQNLKRRRLSSTSGPHKRLRLANYTDGPENQSNTTAKILDLWWKAVNKDPLIMGGMPSFPVPTTVKSDAIHSLIAEHPHKKDRRKKRIKSSKTGNSLLSLVNRNIVTLSRIRRIHSKFLVLSTSTESNNQAAPVPLEPPSDIDADEEATVNEVGWRIGIEQRSADDCLRWMTGKILQHAGFQASATSALSVLMSVVSEYLQNVGRTIRFLCDRYSHMMSPEEIILHTLFEGGISHIQDLERYIKDDIIRYGVRLTELEKKLVSAYRDVTSVDEPDDENILEAEGEADMFLSGAFSDLLGNTEDFLGLRELGIEAEYGLKSLAIPRRLLRGKESEDRVTADRARAGSPLPYPPPPPFVPLEASKVDSQIGLLKSYYQSRFVHLLPTVHPPLSSDITNSSTLYTQEGTSRPSASTLISTSFSHVPPSLILPDDPPNPARIKLSPLGHIIHVNPATATSKKKSKGKELANGSRAEMEVIVKKESKKKKLPQPPAEGAVESGALTEVNGTGPKKKNKSATAKKTLDSSSSLDAPPAIAASA